MKKAIKEFLGYIKQSGDRRCIVQYIYNWYKACCSSVYSEKEKKQNLEEFCSIVLFETWEDAAEKLFKQAQLSKIWLPLNLRRIKPNVIDDPDFALDIK